MVCFGYGMKRHVVNMTLARMDKLVKKLMSNPVYYKLST
jgi:hypothetical protein